jgi:PAN domain
MRFLLNVFGSALVMLAVVGSAQAQLGYDRPGNAYLSFTIKSGDPAVCASRCEHDGRCRAWSFAYPHTRKLPATCWLKRKVMPRVKDDCCVSGVRGAGVIEPRSGSIEYSIARHGGDYKAFATATDPAGAPCRSACEADHRCRAWTYVRPGYNGASARCHLKSKIPRPHRKPCCISGVVR